MNQISTEYNINFFALLFVSFIYVPLSVVSGLALTPLLVILGVIAFSSDKFSFLKKIIKRSYNSYFILLILLALFTSIVSVNVEYSFISLAKVSAVFFCGFVAFYHHKENLDDYYKRILAIIFIAGYTTGIIVISIELMFDGALTKSLRFLINQEEYLMYNVESLNRGACVLAISFWIFVTALLYLKPKKYTLIMIGYWVLVMLIIMFQESSSATLSFIFSSLLFSILLILKCRFLKLYIILFLLFLIIFPLFFLMIPAKMIYQEYPNMPDSMVHRMVIWNFSLSKMSEKYKAGWGFNASRYIPEALDLVPSLVDKNKKWKRIPNHSHNVIIQIGVELGVFGILLLIAYIASFMHFVRLNEKNITKKSIIITIMTSYIIIGFFAFSVWQEWWISNAFLVSILYSSLMSEDSHTKSISNE